MIYSRSPGDVYIGQGGYGLQGYGTFVYDNAYYQTVPPQPLISYVGSSARSPYSDSFPLMSTQQVIWSGSQKDDQVEDGYYWDEGAGAWGLLGEDKGFVLRPYIFDRLFSPKDFTAVYTTSVSSGGRPHWKNMLDDTTNSMHWCPVFWTPKGLALPSYTTASKWDFPTYQAGNSGLSMTDNCLWLSRAPYPVAGLCLVGLMDSTSIGGLINDRTEDLPTAWIGQTDGYATFMINGRPLNYIGLTFSTPWRETVLGFLPWSGKTIKEVCSVTDVTGGIFK